MAEAHARAVAELLRKEVVEWLGNEKDAKGETPALPKFPLRRPSPAPSRGRSPSRNSGTSRADASPATPRAMGITRFLVDTGCGYNLVSRHAVDKAKAWKDVRKLANPVVLSTAGGVAACLGEIEVLCDKIDEGSFHALVMDSTPSVLSVGQRCADYGYSFKWSSRSRGAYLVSPKGRKIPLVIDGNIPYLEMESIEFAAPGPRETLPTHIIQGFSVGAPGALAPEMTKQDDQDSTSSAEDKETVHGFAADIPDDAPLSIAPAHPGCPGPDPQETDESDVEGEPRVANEQKLRLEATSLQHLLTHMPKNPFCRTCVLTKAQRRPARRKGGLSRNTPLNSAKCALWITGSHATTPAVACITRSTV